MYRRGGPPREIVTRDASARWAYANPRPRGGLGDAETESDCPEPTSTADRDALRDAMNEWTNEYMATNGGGHMHEGHPDLHAWLDDLIPRMIGLTQRPKLLRCSNEARKKAREWVSTLEWAYGKNGMSGVFKRTIPGVGNNVVVPKGGVTIRTYNLRDYNVRSFGRWAPEFYETGVETPKPPAIPSPVEGVPFDPSVGGAGGDPTKSAADRAAEQAARASGGGVVTTSGGGDGYASSSYYPSSGASILEGELVPGIPTKYLVYGALALVGFRMLKGR